MMREPALSFEYGKADSRRMAGFCSGLVSAGSDTGIEIERDFCVLVAVFVLVLVFVFAFVGNENTGIFLPFATSFKR